MLQKARPLLPRNLEQLPFAYSVYARDDEEGLKLSLQFKRTFCIDVGIKFFGVLTFISTTNVSALSTVICGSRYRETGRRLSGARRVYFPLSPSILHSYSGSHRHVSRCDKTAGRLTEIISGGRVAHPLTNPLTPAQRPGIPYKLHAASGRFVLVIHKAGEC